MKLTKIGSRITWGLVGLLAVATISVLITFSLALQQSRALDNLHRASDAVVRMELGSDILTSAVRAYAATGDEVYRQAFLTEKNLTRTRDNAVETFLALSGGQHAALLRQAKQESDALIDLEIQIFDLVQQGQHDRAVALAYGERYVAAKASILAPLRALDAQLHAEFDTLKARHEDELTLARIISVLLMLLAMAMLVLVLQGFYRRRIVLPLIELTELSARMLKGEQDLRYPYTEDPGEIGNLSRALQGHQQTLRELDAEREHLRTAEAWNRQIIEFSPDGMLIVDAAGDIIIANPKAHEQFGYPPDGLHGICVDALLPAELRERHAAMRARFSRSGSNRPLTSFSGLFSGVRRDGSEFPLELGLTHLPELAGKSGYTCVTLRDVTQRKQYEQAIADQLEFQRVLLDTLPYPVFFKDAQGHYLGFNQTFLDTFGVTREALLGKSVLEFLQLPLEERLIYQAANERILREGGRYSAEMRIAFADGKTHDALYSLTSYSNSEGQVAGLVGALIDISAQKAAERTQAEAKDLAEEATQLKSDFLANMSHEIRTPMNVIMGMTHLALGSNLDKRQRNYLDKIYTAAQSLLGIINDVLDFSKIEAGKMKLEEVDFLLNDVLSSLADLSTAKAQEKGLELLFDIGVDVPTGLRGDPLRLSQVLTNLLSNALKFTEQGEITLAIHQEQTTGDTTWLRFEVSDTGIGISEEQRQRLFQAFTQADTSTSRRYGGTGLGLTISRRLVELMGGEIGVDSEPGIGSTFYFRAPFRLQTQQHQLMIDGDEVLGMRILVVDDNASAREIFQSMLGALKFDVDTAASAEAAITALEAAHAAGAPYRLVLMDWMMPGTDGVEAIRRIRADPEIAETPFFIMVTAFGREELRERLGDLPIHGLLEKPATPSTLLDCILDAFGKEVAARPHKEELAAEYLQAQQALQGAHLLLVEDNVVNQEMTLEILGRAGIQVDVANNGAEALSMIVHAPYDGVLMDCQMPVMDGFEATGRIRRMKGYEDLPILAMTANAMSGDRERCLAAGMNDHIAKPIDVQQLFIRLHRWIKPGQTCTNPLAVPGIGHRVEPMPEIPGLQVEAALQRLGGNATLLRKLLHRFCETQAEAPSLIAQALHAGDHETATRLAHTLKGLAGNIGARALATQAADLEASLHHGSDVRARLAELDETLAAQIQAIEAASEAHKSRTPPAAERLSVALSPDEHRTLQAGLQQLEALLREDDGEAGKCLDELLEALPALARSEALAKLHGLVGQYRFEEALTSLEALRQALCPQAAPPIPPAEQPK